MNKKILTKDEMDYVVELRKNKVKWREVIKMLVAKEILYRGSRPFKTSDAIELSSRLVKLHPSLRRKHFNRVVATKELTKRALPKADTNYKVDILKTILNSSQVTNKLELARIILEAL